MPAARHFSRSSMKTLAVMAIIGMVFASGRSSARIAFAASRPSISGIITSMRMASKLPGSESRKAASACLPFCTGTVCAPLSCSRKIAISMLSSLSSATSSRAPEISDGVCGEAAAAVASRSSSKGSTTVNWLPSPSLLSTEMVPPICSTSCCTIDMPSPVPI